MMSTLHSLCQECIRKFLGQYCIKDQHCTEQNYSAFIEKLTQMIPSEMQWVLRFPITPSTHQNRCPPPTWGAAHLKMKPLLLEKDKRYGIENLFIDTVLNKENFHGKITQKMGTKSWSEVPALFW